MSNYRRKQDKVVDTVVCCIALAALVIGLALLAARAV